MRVNMRIIIKGFLLNNLLTNMKKLYKCLLLLKIQMLLFIDNLSSNLYILIYILWSIYKDLYIRIYI